MKKYPFRIGAVTGVVRLYATMCVRVCVWMYVCVQVRECACGGSSSYMRAGGHSHLPLSETVTRSVIPLLTIAVVLGNENGRRLDVNTPLRSNSVQIPTPNYFLSFLPQC